MFDELLKKLYGSAYREGKITPDIGATEAAARAFGQAVNEQGGSELDPSGILSSFASSSTYRPTDNYIYTDQDSGAQGTIPELYPRAYSGGSTPPPSGDTGGGGGGRTGDSGDNKVSDPDPQQPSEFERMVARARAAYESALSDADYQLQRAAGLRDENLGLLGQRRKQFQELFDTGNIDITNEYQGRGGELGVSAQNRRSTDAAALQAMGLGGSAVERAQNRQSRDELQGLRSLQQSRDANKAENTRQRDERFSWADTQEAAVNRAYEDAQNARRGLGERASLVLQGDVEGVNRSAGDYLGKILQNQQALEQAGQTVNSFVANPLAVNIPTQADAVAARNYSVNTGAGGTNQGVNLEEQKKKLALLRAQAGGNLYGLA